MQKSGKFYSYLGFRAHWSSENVNIRRNRGWYQNNDVVVMREQNMSGIARLDYTTRTIDLNHSLILTPTLTQNMNNSSVQFVHLWCDAVTDSQECADRSSRRRPNWTAGFYSLRWIVRAIGVALWNDWGSDCESQLVGSDIAKLRSRYVDVFVRRTGRSPRVEGWRRLNWLAHLHKVRRDQAVKALVDERTQFVDHPLTDGQWTARVKQFIGDVAIFTLTNWLRQNEQV